MNVVIKGSPAIILTPPGEQAPGQSGGNYPRLLGIGQFVETVEYLGSAEVSNRTVAVENSDGNMTAILGAVLGAEITVQDNEKSFAGIITGIEIDKTIALEVEQ